MLSFRAGGATTIKEQAVSKEQCGVDSTLTQKEHAHELKPWGV